jgi:hypothetical protein
MKKMYIAWGLIMSGLILSLVFIGLNIKNQNKAYKSLEADMVEQANAYIIVNKVDLNDGESIKFDDNILSKAGLLKSMKVENDECTGYVDVKKKTSGYDAKAYIKCQNYTTEGYID